MRPNLWHSLQAQTPFMAHFFDISRRAIQIGRNRAAFRLVLLSLVAALVAGCTSMTLDGLEDRVPKLSARITGEMSKKGMRPDGPVLVRIFKRESELEVWKQDRTGRYALLKTYPMCRWSGRLGPKTRAGDRQAPEGFYHVSAGMLNPRSQYFLSFNLGYPNRLESALGYTGEALMVHGACSSSGCYAMTDEAVGEIYAIVQKALKGGQERFQVQAFPFRMTADNMARHRNDPNFAFWRTLKEGYDSFELTRRQPKVSACGRRYVFNATFAGGEPSDPLAACPPREGEADTQLLSHLHAQDQKLERALASTTSVSEHGYVDGGMHPSFRKLLQRSGPDRLAARTSTTRYPVSRPDAALADPYTD